MSDPVPEKRFGYKASTCCFCHGNAFCKECFIYQGVVFLELRSNQGFQLHFDNKTNSALFL
jgi:hypothetical protein